MYNITLPEVGENIKSGKIISIAVKPGDTIRKDQDLIELETEKATVPIPSPVDGVVKEILIKVGEVVAIGAVIMRVETKVSESAPVTASMTPISQVPVKKDAHASVAREETTKTVTTVKEPSLPSWHRETPSAKTPAGKEIHVAVIGAGPGGYAAAFLAADLGFQVTLIDKDKNPGGVCLFRGCIPSKALLHAAKILSEAREAQKIGIAFKPPQIDLIKLRDWKQSVVNKLTGGLGQLCQKRQITFIQGEASFLNSQILKIKNLQKGDHRLDEQLPFDKVIMATGSLPIRLPFQPESPRILDSTSALEIEDVPKRLLVIGGGYIGLELGTVYRELGSEVSVVEMMPGLLPGCDRDLVQILAQRLEKLFAAIMLKTKVTGLVETAGGIQVTLEDKKGQRTTKEYDKVLVAIGRKPNAQGLGLENTKVRVNDRGIIAVNAQRQTTDSNIYAIGDIAGEPMLAHKASHEGRVAAEAIAGHKVAFEPQAIPAVVFTDPEIAWCGLTEAEAKEKNRPIQVEKFPWAASGRAVTLNRTDGLTKLVIDPATQRILGVGIVGAGAGELIAEGVLAVEMGAVAADVRLSIHPHPTLSETLMETAESFFGQSTHIYRPKK